MSAENNNHYDEILKSFKDFVINQCQLITQSDFDSSVDEIIASYIVNTIRQFYDEYETHSIWLDNQSAENLDLEPFIEIINEYLCGFDQVDSKSITKWLISLKCIINPQPVKTVPKEETVQSPTAPKPVEQKSNKKIDHNQDANLQTLIEMFPQLELGKIKRIFKKSNYDYDRTVDELLMNQTSSSDSDTESQAQVSEQEKEQLKKRIIQKYGYVEVKDDIDESASNTVVPKVNWNSEKKMVRYYNNQVVTTKGDKYFELKTEQELEEEKKLKSTYINLKPARKYRFH